MLDSERERDQVNVRSQLFAAARIHAPQIHVYATLRTRYSTPYNQVDCQYETTITIAGGGGTRTLSLHMLEAREHQYSVVSNDGIDGAS